MKVNNMIGLFVVAVSVVLGGGAFHLYNNVDEPIQNSETEALGYLRANSEVRELRPVNFYHGSESYQVFEGINKRGEEVLIWVAKSLENHLILRKDAGIEINEVIQFAKTELKPVKMISVKLGIENSIPLYEIIYIDEQDRYSYYYISFKDGTYLKHYNLKS